VKTRIPYLSGGLVLFALAIAACNLFTPPSTPTVALVPSSGIVNLRITIVGTGFGSAQGTSYVTLDGVAAPILSWSDTSITARVPLLPTPGGQPNTAQVVVTVGGAVAGTGTFTVVRGILYCAVRGLNQLICLLNPESSESFDLTSSDISGYPQWSPDGTKVAFVRGGGSGWEGDIYVVDADGTDETRLTISSANELYPAWSPDGTRIVFETGRDGNGEVYLMDADGLDQTNLSQYSGIDDWASWSPDGTRIVFQRIVSITRTGVATPKLLIPHYDVFVMNADGTGQTDISDNAATDQCALWSPDGGKILFQSDRDGNLELYTMNPDGSSQTNLTQNPGADASGAWSPDGSRIAFVSLRDGNFEIYVMNANGSGQMRLTNSPGWDVGPSWSPSGTQITFESDRDGDVRVYVMDEDGTNVRRLTNEESWCPVWTERRWTPMLP